MGRTGRYGKNQCEQMVLAAALQYEIDRCGYLVKHDPPSRVVRDKATKKLKTIYTASSHPDFLGHYQGRAVAIECKHISSKRSLELSEKIVKQGQVDWLMRWAKTGAFGGLLVLFSSLKKNRPTQQAYLIELHPGLPDSHPVSIYARCGQTHSLHVDWLEEDENTFRLPISRGKILWHVAVEGGIDG